MENKETDDEQRDERKRGRKKRRTAAATSFAEQLTLGVKRGPSMAGGLIITLP